MVDESWSSALRLTNASMVVYSLPLMLRSDLVGVNNYFPFQAISFHYLQRPNESRDCRLVNSSFRSRWWRLVDTQSRPSMMTNSCRCSEKAFRAVSFECESVTLKLICSAANLSELAWASDAANTSNTFNQQQSY